MTARIYRPAKNAMQSGRAKTRHWLLEFEQASRRPVDPLMGWTGSLDMRADQLRLVFATREEAVAYAERHGIDYRVEEHNARRVTPKSYAENFRWQRPG
jgi:hypothetical protein